WVWISTHPGATRRSRASTSRCPAPATPPTAVMRSPSIATSPCRHGEPLPSAMVPPRITRSCMRDEYQGRARPVHRALLLLAPRVLRRRACPRPARFLRGGALPRACDGRAPRGRPARAGRLLLSRGLLRGGHLPFGTGLGTGRAALGRRSSRARDAIR